MPELNRPDLWKLVLHAVRTARTAGYAKISSGQYVARYQVPKFERTDAGWPLSLGDRTFTRNVNDPVDWREMYSSIPSQLSGMPLADVPILYQSVRDIVDLCMSDQKLEDGVSLLAGFHKDRPNEKRAAIEREALRLIGTIINRAEATGAKSDEEILDIYKELEQGRFGEQVTGDLFIPIVLTAFELDQPLELKNGMWLEPIEEDIQRARAPSWMRSDRISPYVVAAATHAFVIRNVTMKNAAWGRASWLNEARVDLSDVERFVESIFISTRRRSGYAQVFMRTHGWAVEFVHDLPVVWKITTVEAYPLEFENGMWNQPQDAIDQESLDVIVRIFKSLTNAASNIQLAARRLRRSTMRVDEEDQILDATIGIEALLSKQNDELSHRLSLRAAAVLSDIINPNRTYELMKRVYSQRSTIVHGKRPKSGLVQVGDTQVPAHDLATTLLQQLLRHCLLAFEPWTPITVDDLILQRLSLNE